MKSRSKTHKLSHYLRATVFIYLMSQLAFSWADTSSQPEQGLLILGDSLSAGFGLLEGEEWPALLQQRLLHKKSSVRIINASISGETSLGGASRITALLDRHPVTWLIIELGANDGLRGQSLSQMRDNLSFIIEQAQSRNIKVLLLGMHIPPNYGKRYTQAFHQSFVKVSQAFDVPLIPFFLDGVAGEAALNQADGIHPTAEAQPIILNTVWPAIKTLLD